MSALNGSDRGHCAASRMEASNGRHGACSKLKGWV